MPASVASKTPIRKSINSRAGASSYGRKLTAEIWRLSPQIKARFLKMISSIFYVRKNRRNHLNILNLLHTWRIRFPFASPQNLRTEIRDSKICLSAA